MRLAVVKLGGSSATSASLPDWLAAIEASTLPLVLVPGGGPFADRVRESQQALGYSDQAAHAMALLAMEQFAHVLLGKSERLTAAHHEAEIHLALRERKIPVWFPSAMVLNEPAIPASWDITSDSLAAWLAGQLDGQALLLIKQTDDFSERDTCETLAARGIVDPALPDLLPPLRHAGRDTSPPQSRGEDGRGGSSKLPSFPPRRGGEEVCAANRSGGSKSDGIALHVAGPRHLRDAADMLARGMIPGERIAVTSGIRKAG